VGVATGFHPVDGSLTDWLELNPTREAGHNGETVPEHGKVAIQWRTLGRFVALILAFLVATSSFSQVDPGTFNGLHWRLVGPFRSGRALAVTGVVGHPDWFYFGAVGGGVWFSPNAGRTWKPIFDNVSQASIGDLAVDPKDPSTVYVGTGEADMRSDIQQGDGIYKTVDGGLHWTHLGLTDTRQIGKIVIDPLNSSIIYAAALGHQYGPNPERGVFKSTDGGVTWKKILFKDDNTGAIDLAIDPGSPNVVYASLWQTRRPPWSIYPPSNGPGSGLYKSVDAGETWTQITGGGFPTHAGRIGLSVSPANPHRIYACVDGLIPSDGGVFRSDDDGTTWTHVGTDERIWGRGWYFMGITADPKDPDTVYVMNTSAYRSTDGGKTWTAFKGAPGGDDYHTCWIDPSEPNHMIIGCDQGVIVSVDAGQTWSSWYNQPVGQFYHIVTDNRFPYWIYGSQQDSGAMAVPSRTIHTGISALYQRPIDAGGESGTIAPDPLHPGMLYSSSGSKEDFFTGWEQSIDPTMLHPETVWRSEWTQPIVVSPADPHVVYTSHQQVFRTDDGGSSWKIISPDLTRETSPPLSNLDAPTAADNDGTARRGVVYWLAPSPLQAKRLWAGTDDGLVWLTKDDGAHWSNVTPRELTPWSKVGIIDASHFNPDAAYAAIDRHRLDDNRPYIYKTKDGGKSWALIINGLPDNQFVNVVREDPKQQGLLYAGTDWGIYVSFDDGAKWQPLQLNLPAASVRDIVFGANDVVVGTHGRAIWILDDVAPLRQIAAGTANHLIKPDPAILFQRAGTFGFGRFDEGTPLPPEEPQGENAPWGAIIDYTVDQPGPVVLEVFDRDGKQIRKLTSSDPVPKTDWNRLDIPAYWEQPAMVLTGSAGGHRYLWNLHSGSEGGPLVPPGTYTLKLTLGGKIYSQPLTVVRDPRLPFTDADLQGQYAFAMRIEDEVEKLQAGQKKAQGLLDKHPSEAVAAKLQEIVGGQIRRRRRGMPAGADTTSFAAVASQFEGLEGTVESAPGTPTKDCLTLFATLKAKAEADFAVLRSVGAG